MYIPIVSVIVPNYNHQSFLKKRIDSILNQTFQNFELIILDDASTDNSVDILNNYKTHPKVSHFIINNENSGSPFKQWEKGIKLAKGQFIWITETDDWAEPDFLKFSLARMQKNPSLGFSISRSNVVDSLENLIGDTFKSISLKNPDFKFVNSDSLDLSTVAFLEGYFLGKSVVHNASSVLFRKEIVSNDLNFIKDKKQLGDTFFWVSLALKSEEIVFLNKVLNNFRRHENAVTSVNYTESREQVILEEFELLDYIVTNTVFRISRNVVIKGFKRLSKKYAKFKLNSNKKHILKFNAAILRLGNKHDKLFIFRLLQQIIITSLKKIKN